MTNVEGQNIEGLRVRKWYSFMEEVAANENYQAGDGEALTKFAVAAVVRNPYAGRFAENLDDIITPSYALGVAIGERAVALGAGRVVESYGKGIVVGAAGEYEHGNAFITNVGAGPVRDAIGGGVAWVPSTGKRGGIGTSIDVPLALMYMENDPTVDPNAARSGFRRWGSSHKELMPVEPEGDAVEHVFVGDALAPQRNDWVVTTFTRFLDPLVRA